MRTMENVCCDISDLFETFREAAEWLAEWAKEDGRIIWQVSFEEITEDDHGWYVFVYYVRRSDG